MENYRSTGCPLWMRGNTYDAWIKKFTDRICVYYGEDAREQAEDAARAYLDGGDVRDDPDAAAVLIMEGWAMARRSEGGM